MSELTLSPPPSSEPANLSNPVSPSSSLRQFLFQKSTDRLSTAGATVPKDASTTRCLRHNLGRHPQQPPLHGDLCPVHPARSRARERNYMWHPSSQEFV
jgi:hypothetical protein